MSWDVAARHPALAILACVAFSGIAAYGATQVRTEVDFVDAVPADEPGLDAYRALLEGLDGIRFVAIHMPYDPASGLGSLRTDEGFDALVAEQQALTDHIEGEFPPGTFSHSLSVYEAMRAGNYMFHKVLTAGNPPDDTYSLPSNPAAWSYVRDEVRGDSGKDVLAADGTSALLLLFLATDDALEARELSGDVGEILARWSTDSADQHPATEGHQASGLLYSSHYTDERNRDDLAKWGLASTLVVAVAMLVVLRRPSNVLIAAASIGAATLWTFGTLGLLSIPISFLTVFLAPLVSGIGVDYAVHILQRHEEERDAGRTRREASILASRHTGLAVAVSAATTALGLLVLLLVPAPLFSQIGGVAALGIGFGFLASILITPALRRVLPEFRSSKPRRDPVGRGVEAFGMGALHRPAAVATLLVVLTIAAILVALTQTRVESGSAENEFPQDDPVIQLQQRIEKEYGAFQRAYIVVQGDMADAEALRALNDATGEAEGLPLYRSSSSVTSLLLADAATDQGALDILLGTAAPPADEDQLPADDGDAQAALDRLFEDPLWSTLAPFTITRDYSLAVVAVQVDPWDDQEELGALRDALRRQAATLQDALGPEYKVSAAGAPVNRAAVIEQTPIDVALATLGVVAVVGTVLVVSWRRHGWVAVRQAGAVVGILLVATVWLIASIPLLDHVYGWMASGGAPSNSAALNDMFLLAFAITVASGVDNLVHLIHRHREELEDFRAREDVLEKQGRSPSGRASSGTSAGVGRRSASTRWAAPSASRALHARGPDQPIAVALRTGGKAITGTSATTFLAFAVLSGVYFLQSKNLAILTALGILYVYVLTILVGPFILRLHSRA